LITGTYLIKGLTLTPLKPKLQNQYFLHPPGVASTARYRVLLNSQLVYGGHYEIKVVVVHISSW